jgi:hypothetical protein
MLIFTTPMLKTRNPTDEQAVWKLERALGREVQKRWADAGRKATGEQAMACESQREPWT